MNAPSEISDTTDAAPERRDEIAVSTPIPADNAPPGAHAPDEVAHDDADQGSPASGKHRSTRATRPRTAHVWLSCVALLTAAAIALAVFSILWTIDVRAHDSATDRRNAVLAASTVAMNDLVNLSGKDQASAEKQLNALVAVSTGSFKSQFSADITGEAKLFVQAKAVSVGKIDAVGVSTLTRKTATATVAAEAKITNSQSPQGKTTYYKMTVALAYQKGRWLVSSVGFVP